MLICVFVDADPFVYLGHMTAFPACVARPIPVAELIASGRPLQASCLNFSDMAVVAIPVALAASALLPIHGPRDCVSLWGFL